MGDSNETQILRLSPGVDCRCASSFPAGQWAPVENQTNAGAVYDDSLKVVSSSDSLPGADSILRYEAQGVNMPSRHYPSHMTREGKVLGEAAACRQSLDGALCLTKPMPREPQLYDPVN